ncbi:MAG: hypothetical protein AAB805_01210 [Patescibacteria group bacterium]
MDIHISSLLESLRGKISLRKEGGVPAYRHWKIILFAYPIFLIAAFVLASLFFVSANKSDSADQGGAPTRASALKKTDVESVLSEYAEKRKNFENLLLQQPPFIDPSR